MVTLLAAVPHNKLPENKILIENVQELPKVLPSETVWAQEVFTRIATSSQLYWFYINQYK